MCSLGKLLSEARDIIGSYSKLWGNFCRHELSMEPRTARRWIRVYSAWGDEPPPEAIPTALEILAAPYVPDKARQEAYEHALAGQRVTTKKAREIIQRHKAGPLAGSNAGHAEPLDGVHSDALYKLRSAIRIAIRDCAPKKRVALVGRLHELVDTIWREVEFDDAPFGRGETPGMPAPDADEIGRRAAEIRAEWSPEKKVRRKA